MSLPASDPDPTRNTLDAQLPAPRPVERVAVITHGDPDRTHEALSRVVALVTQAGVRVLMPTDELAKHPATAGLVAAWDEPSGPCDLCLVLGGDGTILRALHRFLATDVPVIGVNYGRVGFLTSIMPEEVEERLPGVLRGDYDPVSLPTMDVYHQGRTHVALNDVIVTSAVQGRMAVLEWGVNGIGMGERGCDGVVIATATGSTGYNLSAGGPVVSWGVDAIGVTFIAPHALDLRPLILSRGHVISVLSRSIGFASRIVADGHTVGSLEYASEVTVRLGASRGILGVLRDRPFLARYRATFGR